MLTGLVRQQGSPLFVISKAKLLAQVDRFRELLPRVEPFYAAKANSHPAILKVFAKAKLGFDVASQNEIDALLELGVPPAKLVFANTVKQPVVLTHAKKRGVDLMTFDSEYELNKIAKYFPGARVLVRIKVPNVGSVVELSVKFGVEPADAIPLLIKAKRLGLNPIGVSFHVGSQCTKVENYVESFEVASIIMHDAQLKQLPLEIVDIGGGFPIRYLHHDEDIFAQMAPVINQELDRLFDNHIRLIAEPGRCLVGPAGTLVMQVIGKSIRANKHWYYLNDGVYGALSGIIFDHSKYEYQVFKKGPTQLSTLAGPTCDSLDVISYTEELPELEFGDIVYVENIGAYSLASSTQFNSLLPPKVVVVD